MVFEGVYEIGELSNQSSQDRTDGDVPDTLSNCKERFLRARF